eukprot:CAMPEP_0206811998 /NCGR_PEP_ID=MMETSP0975-20121206/7543_1 /ASSEMBLY_ACC=CAM_ASM_000399 /TAXON_ID=483370 /ORGANISM="non described non described, Strain CCMP2097" /LENGTH=292 /DNA_ID=CAMNT_0054354131 /DNA_START=36 /DNA_END=910 /DNA_ORIENTATION=-
MAASSGPAAGCALVVMGLPGAGKSTLVSGLAGLAVDGVQLPLQRLEYDEYLDTALDSNDGEFDAAAWRASRRDALASVQSALAGGGVVLVDDNAAYRSMRHAVFQAARDCGCAFATLYVSVDARVALQRNAARPAPRRVPEATISRMASQLEAPDAAKHAWEKHSATLTSSGCCADDALLFAALAQRLVADALRAGAPPKPLDDEAIAEQLEAGRLATAASLAHGVDLRLRLLVGDAVKRTDGLHKKAVAAVLAKTKRCGGPFRSVAAFASAAEAHAAESLPAATAAALKAA